MSSRSTLFEMTIVFDLDGTLVDTAHDLVLSLNTILNEYHLRPVPMHEAHNLIGGGARALLLKGLEWNRCKNEDYDIAHMVNAFINDYKTHISVNSAPYEGCLNALEFCQRNGAKLAVCTNKHEALARQLLDELNLTPFFHSIVGGNSLPVSKPDPRTLRAAITRAGGNIHNAVLVGDSATDLNTAYNCSIPFIGVTFGYSDPPMVELAPQRLISHYSELPALLNDFVSTAFEA